MARKGILGLAGGSLVLVILALAYIFTDKGREVGDNLGARAVKRIDTLFAGEEASGEESGPAAEGTFTEAAPPEVAAPQPPQRAPQVPGAAVPGVPDPPPAQPEVPHMTRREAAYAALNARAQAGEYIPVVAPGQPSIFSSIKNPAAADLYENSRIPGNFGFGQIGTIGSPKGAQFIVAGHSGFRAAVDHNREYVQRADARAAAAQTATQSSSPGPEAVSARVAAAADRGRRLATERQTQSPSLTRPKQQSGAEIYASYQAFLTGNSRGAQFA